MQGAEQVVCERFLLLLGLAPVVLLGEDVGEG
jgi:hypothetical protein